jgi:hypothetical protein
MELMRMRQTVEQKIRQELVRELRLREEQESEDTRLMEERERGEWIIQLRSREEWLRLERLKEERRLGREWSIGEELGGEEWPRLSEVRFGGLRLSEDLSRQVWLMELRSGEERAIQLLLEEERSLDEVEEGDADE